MYLGASGVRNTDGEISGNIDNAAAWHGVVALDQPRLWAEYVYSQIKLHWRRSTCDADPGMALNGPSAGATLRW